MRTLFGTLILLFVLTACAPSQDGLENYSVPLADLLDSLSLSTDRIRLRIDKSDYVLSVLSDTMVLKQYPVVFGGNPIDDKFRRGDRCTPEGDFRVLSRYPHRSWNKFIWIDYPNDASWEKHRQAKRDGIIDETADIGGEIGIHGVPRGTDRMIDLRMNWTLGCIALKNKDIDDFYPYIREGTHVRIQP